MADPGNALVVWGSTGRRLQFSMQDLRMPESLRDDPHYHFYEKQWDAVAGFWFNRVLKEASLQHLEVEKIVELIRSDIAKRWEKRRQEQNLHKKRKRLLRGDGPAGAPAESVLLTNVVALAEYRAASEDEKQELVRAVVERVESVAKEKVERWEVLVDDDASVGAPDTASDEAPDAKKPRTEQPGEPPGTSATDASATTTTAAGESAFDDRVAVVCTLSSKEKAATVIAHLHGSHFDSRGVVCRFFVLP